jgi:histidinol-phosphate aminotransferase
VRGGDGKPIRDELARRGILIRYYNKPGLRDCVRVSIGTPEQNDRLLIALREVVESTQGVIDA